MVSQAPILATTGDATVIAVLHQVTSETAVALGDLARRGYLVTAVVVAFAAEPIPDWARPPEWANLLLAHGVDGVADS